MLSRSLQWGVRALLVLCLPTMSFLHAANPRTSNPSHSDPDQALAIHGDEQSAKLQAECSERHVTLAKIVPPLLQRVAKGQADKNDPDKLSEAHLACLQLTRLARRLLPLGEPAGYEFGLRATFFSVPTRQAIGSFVNTPAGIQYTVVARQRLMRLERERAATLKKLNELVQKKQYDEAERVWFAYLEKVLELTVFLSPDEGRPYIDPFVEISSHITMTMDLNRATFGKELLSKRRDSQRPDVASLTAQISAAAGALRKSDRVMIDNAALSGPEAFAHFVESWQKMHASAIRCQGLTWALQSAMFMGAGMNVMSPVAGNPTTPKNDPALEEYRSRSASQISQAFAELVAADAMRVTPDEAPALYLAWLNAVAPHVGRVQNDSLARALEPALIQLAGRSPGFLAQVMGYDEATRELLRWKRRTADAATAPFVTNQPAVEVAFQKAFTSETGYVGLFSADGTDNNQPTFHAAAPTLLPDGCKRLLQQEVILTLGQGLSGGKSNVTRLRTRSFATLKPNPAALANAVATLESELLVSTESPPLTLATAAALRSLQLGDFVTCGGEVTGVYLEGWLTRLAGLPDAAWPLFPLGDLPVAHDAQRQAAPSLDKAAARFEIDPKWLRHEYVIVPLAKGEE